MPTILSAIEPNCLPDSRRSSPTTCSRTHVAFQHLASQLLLASRRRNRSFSTIFYSLVRQMWPAKLIVCVSMLGTSDLHTIAFQFLQVSFDDCIQISHPRDLLVGCLTTELEYFLSIHTDDFKRVFHI